MTSLGSAHGLQYPITIENSSRSFILKVQEWQTERGGISYGSEMFRESREQSSDKDKGTRPYSDVLGPSFDIPDSVDGRSRAVSPWWDRRSTTDPMVEDLSRMDSGISGPGSPW